MKTSATTTQGINSLSPTGGRYFLCPLLCDNTNGRHTDTELHTNNELTSELN